MKSIGPSLVAVITSSLLLSGCGGKEKPVEEEGLRPGNSSANPQPTVPKKPILNIQEDLTVPEGTIKAFFAYLNYGRGSDACDLLSKKIQNAYGPSSGCEKNLTEYASGVLPAFDSKLDLNSAIKIYVKKTDSTTASGSAILTTKAEGGRKFVESFKLSKIDGKWLIVDVATIDSEPEY